MQRRFKVILETNESGGFTVTVPELPGCFTQGANRKEALEHVQEAIEGFLEELVIEGLPIPSSTLLEMDEVQVSY